MHELNSLKKSKRKEKTEINDLISRAENVKVSENGFIIVFPSKRFLKAISQFLEKLINPNENTIKENYRFKLPISCLK